MQTNEKYAVPALIRALDVLEFVAQRQSASFAEIREGLGLSKSTAYGILNTLLSRGCLRPAHQPGRYQLGMYLFSLGSRCLAGLDIRDEALPVLRELTDALDQTCHLGVLDRGEAVYLAKVECSQNMVLRSWVGKRFSLRTTAMGKVLLAWRPEDEVRDLLETLPLNGGTERAIRDPRAYREQLVLVRRQGYAVDDRENVEEARCVAAPVFSTEPHPIAAVSVSAPYERMPLETLPQVGAQVRKAARKISERLGCRSYPCPEPSEAAS